VLAVLDAGVTVTPGWLGVLLDAPEAIPDAGITGPLTNYGPEPQLVEAALDARTDAPDSAAARLRATNAGQVVVTDELGAFCFALRRDVARATGGFDET